MLDSVLGDLDELKDIMSKSIDNVAMRGERLELLVNKTENLSTNVSKIISCCEGYCEKNYFSLCSIFSRLRLGKPAEIWRARCFGRT